MFESPLKVRILMHEFRGTGPAIQFGVEEQVKVVVGPRNQI